jgi:transcriptional regulator with XRE-family HTH domain
MNRENQAALEAKGYVFEDAEDFLNLNPEEHMLVDLRLTLSRAIRKHRTRKGLTQRAVAEQMGTSQPRFANLESASQDVSLDAMFRAFFLLGGSLNEIPAGARTKAMRHAKAKSSKASATKSASHRRRAPEEEPVGSGSKFDSCRF